MNIKKTLLATGLVATLSAAVFAKDIFIAEVVTAPSTGNFDPREVTVMLQKKASSTNTWQNVPECGGEITFDQSTHQVMSGCVAKNLASGDTYSFRLAGTGFASQFPTRNHQLVTGVSTVEVIPPTDFEMVVLEASTAWPN